MVDSVDNSYNQALVKQQAALARLNASSTVGPVLNKKAQTNSVTPVNLNAVKQSKKLDTTVAFSAQSSKTPPPRGSIVDRLV